MREGAILPTKRAPAGTLSVEDAIDYFGGRVERFWSGSAIVGVYIPHVSEPRFALAVNESHGDYACFAVTVQMLVHHLFGHNKRRVVQAFHSGDLCPLATPASAALIDLILRTGTVDLLAAAV